jgi:hypothetical protein
MSANPRLCDIDVQQADKTSPATYARLFSVSFVCVIRQQLYVTVASNAISPSCAY